jgi:hypothetical protein
MTRYSLHTAAKDEHGFGGYKMNNSFNDIHLLAETSTNIHELDRFPIDARRSYRRNQERFHEFMIGIVGMSVFDAVEIWLLSDQTKDLYVVAALHRDEEMQMWTSQSKNLRLKSGDDVPGICLRDSSPYWDTKYNMHNEMDRLYPRALAAKQLSVKTAFGVPLPGPSGACGAFVLYSKQDVMLSFISFSVTI